MGVRTSADAGLTTGPGLAGLVARRDATAVAIGLLFVVQAAIRFDSPISHDAAWYLYAAGRLLDGAVLYVDIVEVNPPLGIWLSIPFVMLARASGLPAILLFQAGVFGLSLASLLLSARFIRATDIPAPSRHLLLFLVAALMLFLPAYDFGQREHLLVLLATPWLFLRWGRVLGREQPTALAILAGTMAAIGFWLKPHSLIAAIAIEGAVLLMTRDPRVTFRAETMAAVAVSVLYLAATWLFAEAFFTRMIPLGTAAYLPFYGPDRTVALKRLAVPLLLVLAAGAGGVLVSAPFRRLGRLLLAGGIAFLVAYLLQAGFRYQVLPALYLLALGAGLVLVDRDGAQDAGARWRIGALPSAAALVVLLGTVAPIQTVPYNGAMFERAIASEAPGARSIFIASTNVSNGFPLVEEGDLVWGSRYPTLWLAPYASAHLDSSGAPTDAISHYALASTVDDLLAFEPDVVFINESPSQAYFRGPPLDYVAFWKNDPRFVPFWTRYSRQGTADGFGVYVREGGARPNQ